MLIGTTRIVRIFLALLIVILMTAPHGIAQTTTGSVYGTVMDPTGAVIAGAGVQLKNVDTSATLTTKANSSGAYVFPVVQPGRYTVTSSVTGFTSETLTGITVDANQNVNASFSLKAGAVESTVNVEAGTTLVDTRESQLADTVDEKRIQDLPLGSRNAYALVQLVPGITKYSETPPIGGSGGTQFSTNGLRPNFNSFYLDGSFDTSFFRGGGNIIPNPDALGQFRVITSNFDAEFGRYPGAVVNAITRSGTNDFHGTIYDFVRNNIFNAKNYFSTTGVTPLHYNMFGGGIGGPAIRDRLFFFLSYQGLRISSEENVFPSSLVLPTAAERTGDFRQSAKKPRGPFCGTQYVICPSALDTVSMNIINRYVPLGINGTSVAAEQSAPAPTIADQGTARIDYQLNPAHTIHLTVFDSMGTGRNATNGSNQLLDFGGINTYGDQSNYVIADTWIPSPRAVNTLTGFYTHTKTGSRSIHSGGTMTDLGGVVRPGAPNIGDSQPQFTVTGYFKGGTGGPGHNDTSVLIYGLSDTFNLTKGNHTIKFGGSFMENQYHENAIFNGSSSATFNGSATGNALADFLEGKANSFGQNSGAFHRTHAPDPSLFVQDDWRVRRRLTLNLGLRWEVYYPLAGQNNLGTFVPGVQSKRFPTAPLGLLSSGDPGVPDGLLHVSYLSFAPRVGFGWDMFGDGKTSLRGGYGIAYAQDQETFAGNSVEEPFALAVSLQKTSSYTNPFLGIAPFNGVSPFPYTVNLQNPVFLPGAQLTGVPKDVRAIPSVQQWNLTMEQQYGNNWSTRISYVGSAGRHFYLARDQNAPVYVPGASSTTAGINARRPYSGYGPISLLDPSNNSSYNSLQASITRRLTNRFSLKASYTWSKSLDYVSSDPGSLTAYTLADQTNIRRDYGLSNNDQPQSFTASFIYELPAYHLWGLFGREVLTGWQINGIETLNSGNPFNITSNVDTNLDGVSTDRPNLIGNPSLGSHRTRAQNIDSYFNTDAFAVPTGPYGNLPRNALIGPGQVDTDLSAMKHFALYRESRLTFRAEAFNLFNNVNLNNPVSNMGNANFGKITGAGGARYLQFALKLEF